MQEFTLVPVFAQFLDGFTIEESVDMGAPSDLEVSCDACLGTVIALAEGVSLRHIVTAVVDHRCDTDDE